MRSRVIFYPSLVGTEFSVCLPGRLLSWRYSSELDDFGLVFVACDTSNVNGLQDLWHSYPLRCRDQSLSAVNPPWHQSVTLPILSVYTKNTTADAHNFTSPICCCDATTPNLMKKIRPHSIQPPSLS